jgi:hypothetical protein
VVDLFQKLPQDKEILNNCKKNYLNNIPGLLEKERRLTIRTRGFIVANTKQHLFLS